MGKWDSLASPVYHSADWRRVRKLALQRDGGLCVRGCGRTAKDVDHIVPLMDGGAPFDLANLQSLCRTCHNRKGKEGQSTNWRRAPTHIWLIVGPPGADLLGKVRELQRHPSDLVIDSDLIAASLFEVTYSAELGREDALEVQLVRNRLITDLRRGVVPRFAVRCFLTSTNPRAAAFLPHHTVVEVDPGLAAIHLDVETGRLPAIFRELALAYYAAKVAATEGLAKRNRAELHIATDPLEAA